MGITRDLHEARENLPTHEEIAKRAYELYLKDREKFSPTEYWLKAKEELRQEHAKRREPVPSKCKTGVTDPFTVLWWCINTDHSSVASAKCVCTIAAKGCYRGLFMGA
ncbi:MAG TPA: hypothetical protein VNE63_04935 [Candidatus Acidoferrales bacterium]|nr:hypothetical protein [Candidatus Acidoferrales bacterium]